MSSNPNLPAGFFITTVNGKRCTAVPRALTTITGVSTTSALVRPTSTPTGPATSSTPIEPSTQIPESPADVLPSSAAEVVAAVPVITSSQITIANEPLETQTPRDTPTPQDTQAPQDTQIPTTTQITEPSPSPTALAVAELTTSSPTPEVETATQSSSASTSIPSSPSDFGISPPNPVNSQNDPLSATETTSSPVSPGPTTNSAVPAQASFLDTTSKSRVAPAPIVGGVMGSLAFLGFVALIFWLYKRRRRHQRNSLLTPLRGERGSFNDGDRESISDEKLMSRFGAKLGYQTDRLKDFSSGIAAGVVGFGASLKSKVIRNQRDTPSVDLNRGNSQFFDGPIPQHSRNNSVMSNIHSQHTVKDRFNDWWERCVEIVGFNWTLRRNKRLLDPFTMAGGLSEKQSGSNGAPDFSQFPHINERDLQLHANGQQGITLPSNSDGPSVLDFGNLGPNFESNNPFSDPLPPVASTAQKQPINKDNPFIDPVTQTQSPSTNKNTYVADVRRSRGQPTKPTKNNQAELRSSTASRRYSRYQSGVTVNRDSSIDRDTFVSFMSASGRRGKGRSDPFDLERPELWISSKAYNQDIAATSNRPNNTRGSSILYPDPLRMSSVHGNKADQVAHTRPVSNDLSIYSSGVSNLGGWAGPGPDLGPGSSSTSMRGNASSDAGSHYRNDSTGGVYGPGDGSIKGNLSEMDLALAAHQRDLHNVSPLSVERNLTVMQESGSTSPVSMVSKYSRRGVGKAL